MEEEASVELKTVKAFKGAGLESTMMSFLEENGFITEAVRLSVIDIRTTLNVTDKTNSLVEGIKNRIVQDEDSYKVLVDKFKQSGVLYKPIVKKLALEYEKQSAAANPKELSSQASYHPPPSQSTPLQSHSNSYMTLERDWPSVQLQLSNTLAAITKGRQISPNSSECDIPAAQNLLPSMWGMIVMAMDVAFLMDFLFQHSYRWEVIGTALRFLPGELQNIRHSPQLITPQQCLNAVLCGWVQWPTTAHSQDPTMEMLRDALRSELLGLGAVGNEIYAMRDQLPSQRMLK